MSFWGSLFGGQNTTLNSDINQTGQLSGFASGLGQNNTTQGSNFYSSILSGDPTKIGQALAPAISAGQQGAQQQKNQTAQFGNRAGGTNASMQAIDASTRGNITNLVGGLQSGAASTLLNSGQSLLGTALGGYNQQAAMSQQQMQNWANSILGKGISGAAAAGESFALGGFGGGAGAGSLDATASPDMG
jgi:hypothetical protein